MPDVTGIYLAAAAMVVMATLVLCLVAALIVLFLDPWLERRQDLRRMIGK